MASLEAASFAAEKHDGLCCEPRTVPVLLIAAERTDTRHAPV